jgi:RNA polymerase sigma-70 factor (ECF subfamily)
MCYKSGFANFFPRGVYLDSDSRDRQDVDCVARCLRGDLDAFEPLVGRYERVLFRVALRLTGEYEDARDATQNSFVKAFEQLHRYDGKRKFFSWIYRIAVNECLNLRRSRRPQEALTERLEDADSHAGPFEAFAQAEARGRIDRAMADLSFEYREVIALRHFADLSYEEMADAIGVPEKTVKSRLFSARQKLAGLLGMAGDANDGE